MLRRWSTPMGCPKMTFPPHPDGHCLCSTNLHILQQLNPVGVGRIVSLEDQVTEVVESTQNCSWQSHVFGSSSIFCWFSQVNSQYSMLAPTFSWSIIWTETRQGHTAAAGSKLHLNDCQEQTWHGDVAAWTCNVGRVNPNCIHMEVSWNGGTTLSSNLVAFSVINYPFGCTLIYGTPLTYAYTYI